MRLRERTSHKSRTSGYTPTALLPELSGHVLFISMRLAHTLSRVLSSSSCTYLMHEGFETLHVHVHIIPRHVDDHVQLGQRAPEAPREELDRMGAQLRKMYELSWPSRD